MATHTGNGTPRSASVLLSRLLANAFTLPRELGRRSAAGDVRRDIDQSCGWPKDPIPAELYWALYAGDPYANRVCVIRPRASWQSRPDVYEDEDTDTETVFEAALKDLGKQLEPEPSYLHQEKDSALWNVLRTLDELSGVGQYGILLIGLNDGLPLDQPAKSFQERNSAPSGKDANGEAVVANVRGPYRLTVNADAAKGTRLTYLRVFPEWMVPVATFENNPTSPRYGQPVTYTVQLNDPAQEQQGPGAGNGLNVSTKTVHWTRVVHVAEGLSTSPVFAMPRMRHVVPALLDARKVRGASAEGFWQNAFALLALMTDPSLGGDVEFDVDQVKDMMEEIRNGLQRDMVLNGLTPQTVAPSVNDPTSQLNVQVEAICVGTDTPKRIFLGSERGELSSSQDERDWKASTRLRNTDYVTPGVVGRVINRFINLGVQPKPESGDYLIDWPDVSTQTDAEKAAVLVQRVTAHAQYVGGQVESLMTPLDYLTREAGYSEEEAEAILDAQTAAEEEAQQEAALAPPGMPGAPPAPPGAPPGSGFGGPPKGPPVQPGPPQPVAQEEEEADPWKRFRRAGQPSANTFCPTGPGGGIDNSCGKGEGGAPGERRPPPGNEQEAKSRFAAISKDLFGHDGGREQHVQYRMPGDKTVIVGLRSHGKNHDVAIDFAAKGDDFSSTAKELSAGGLGVLRKVREVAERFHREGFRIEVSASDARRGDLYSKHLERMGLKKVEDKWGKQVWNFAAAPAANTFCPTGPGGGIDPTCGKDESGFGAGASSVISGEKAKFVGAVVGKAEHVRSGEIEADVARSVGGKVASLEGGVYAPRDVQAGNHALEVKSLLKGEKQSISVHEDALLRKVDYVAANPGTVYHTVVVDDRDNYQGGAFRANYSGHDLYYRRGNGRYSLSQMHPVASKAELKRLISMPDHQLPEKARGSLPPPPPLKELRARAEKAHTARLAKDRARKLRIREGRTAATQEEDG